MTRSAAAAVVRAETAIEVDAGLGEGVGSFERDRAGHADGGVGQALAYLLDCLFRGGWGHAVEQDGSGTARDGVGEILRRTHLHLDDLLAAG